MAEAPRIFIVSRWQWGETGHLVTGAYRSLDVAKAALTAEGFALRADFGRGIEVWSKESVNADITPVSLV